MHDNRPAGGSEGWRLVFYAAGNRRSTDILKFRPNCCAPIVESAAAIRLLPTFGAIAMDRLKALSMFKAVVDRGGFSRAAVDLDMSCGQVSRGIQALERALGVQLLRRTTRHLSLTAAGEDVLHRAAALLEAYAELAAVGRQNSVAGAIRLAAPVAMGRWLMSRSLVGFMADYPQATVRLRLETGPLELCRATDDLALCRTQDLRPSLIARRVASCSVVLFASPGYVARQGSPTTPAELASHACLGVQDEQSPVWNLRHVGASDDFPVMVQRTLETGHVDMVLEAAERGAGIALLPVFAAEASVHAQRLQQVLPQWCSAPLDLHVAYHSRANQPIAVRALIGHLADTLSSPPAAALPALAPHVELPLPARAFEASRCIEAAPLFAA